MKYHLCSMTSESSSDKNPSHISRVSQVDAEELDNELFSVLKSQVLNAFKYLRPGLIGNIEPEINALLRFIIVGISLKKCEATVGQQLLLIKYKNQSNSFQRRLGIYTFGIIACHWLKDRSDYLGILISRSGPNIQWLHKILDWSETALRIASVINFFVFLQKGKYLNLLERTLGLEKIPTVTHGIRQFEYDYMARELLWHGFAEFITFFLPLVNWNQVKKWCGKRVQTDKSHCRKNKDENSDYLNIQECGICEQWLCNPYTLGCHHAFCYYCIMSQVLSTDDCSCPICGYETSIDCIRPL